MADRAEAVESARSSAGDPGPAKFIDVAASAVCDGDGNGDGSPLSKKGRRTAVTGGVWEKLSRFGEYEGRPLVEARGVTAKLRVESGGGILTGNGKSGPLFFLRPGRRKKVVVVETVCVVVVVVAYTP